jgi:acyl-CoA synthetase (AMP-forming)/AMP-acid ligase II
MNFGMILRRSARNFADKAAVQFEDRQVTYAQLYDRACRVTNALLGLGVRPGDRVCTLGDNSLESMEEICGLALGGFVRSPMYTQNPVDVQLYMLDTVQASATPRC